ncbi:hypothetical protein BJ165DRAFT_1562458 [Panaeolus papilionaceus]|nr:hypothetical protein BJ165DRAFT_1562458 [Panaeolus papilionaceus]
MVLLYHPFLDPRDTHDGPACDSDRSLGNIVWSCSLTLFACTWVAVHPEVPSRDDPGSTVVARRIGLMLSMLIFPELVILWAFSQWVHAIHYTQKFAGGSLTFEPQWSSEDKKAFIYEIMYGFFAIFYREGVSMELLRQVGSNKSRCINWINSNLEVEGSIIVLFGGLFGIIHLIAWDFHFPTTAEMWLWRISSLVLTVSPLIFMLFGHFVDKAKQLNNASLSTSFTVLALLSCILYVIARVFLIILSLVSLRDLP